MNKLVPIVLVMRRFREKQGMSRYVLAKKIGISERTLNRYESGESDMGMNIYHKYLNALNITHMDVAIALQAHDAVLDNSIASSVRRLPPKMKKAVLKFLNDLAESTK